VLELSTIVLMFLAICFFLEFKSVYLVHALIFSSDYCAPIRLNKFDLIIDRKSSCYSSDRLFSESWFELADSSLFYLSRLSFAVT